VNLSRFRIVLAGVLAVMCLQAQSPESAEALSQLAARTKQPRNPFCEHPGCKISHKVLCERDVPELESKIVVTASNEPQNTCHACGPFLSLFEFQHRQSGWALAASEFAFTSWGNFGEAYAGGIKAQKIANDAYGLFLEGGGTNQGYTDTSVTIYARVRGRFRRILNLPTGEDDSGSLSAGGNHWESEYKLEPGSAGFYDLVVTSHGVRDGKKFSQSRRFRFNGTQYAARQ
jgi:hypothetical protein